MPVATATTSRSLRTLPLTLTLLMTIAIRWMLPVQFTEAVQWTGIASLRATTFPVVAVIETLAPSPPKSVPG